MLSMLPDPILLYQNHFQLVLKQAHHLLPVPVIDIH